MNKQKKNSIIIFTLILLGAVLSGCVTPPPEIPENMTQPEIFQRAQESLDREEWDNALIYYQTFLERFPEDTGNVVAAEYEIAFIYYKKRDYDIAKERFKVLLTKYETLDSPGIPEWPKILSEKLIVIIDEKLAALAANAQSATTEIETQ